MLPGSVTSPRRKDSQSPPNSVRVLADTNIVAQAVRALRRDGHDVVHVAERAVDPGDAALLAEAVGQERVFITKDHDIGALVHRNKHAHLGVLLVDDLGNAEAETRLILSVLSSHATDIAERAFLRASEGAVRKSESRVV